jgi:hypothetical protein
MVRNTTGKSLILWDSALEIEKISLIFPVGRENSTRPYPPRLSGLPPFAPGNKLSADTGRRCEASRGESGWICGARSRW